MPKSGESLKAVALRVVHAAFTGIAPLLVEHGITSSEAEALLRAVCVHAAARAHTAAGKRPNISSVSVKTGVDRHLVAALLKSTPEADVSLSARRDSMSRVIDGWLSDLDYTDKGTPKDLPIGDASAKGRSVWTLVQRYAPGVWPRLIVDELIRVDYVTTLSDGRLRWKGSPSSKSLPKRGTREGIDQLMHDVVVALFRESLQTDVHHKWRTAQSFDIAERDLPLVRKMLRDRLDSMFAWMTDELNSARWQSNETQDNAKVRVGLSGFTFEEPLARSSDNEKRTKIRRTNR